MNRKQRRAQGHGRNKSAQAATSGGGDPLALHEAGVQAYRAGDADKAAALIQQAIAGNGLVPSFHYNLGIVLKAQRRLKDAAASYRRAIRLKPDYVEAHNNLGNVLKALGKSEEAQASFAQALALRPGYAEAHYNLGVLFSERDDRAQAAAHLQACLAQDPGDSHGAEMLLAYLGLTAAPRRTTQAQLINLYDQRSRSWDEEQSYHGHERTAQALREHAGAAKWDILDAGCGTGLAGALVRDLATRLDGVDLSAAMLEKAQGKQIYDRLFCADLVPFLSQHSEGYDAIIAAAVLIHFGDLAAVFAAAAGALRAGGLFAFTLFADRSDGADFRVAAHFDLARHGCYQHGRSYVERVAREAGFTVEIQEEIVHEHDLDGNPVTAILAVLRRP